MSHQDREVNRFLQAVFGTEFQSSQRLFFTHPSAQHHDLLVDPAVLEMLINRESVHIWYIVVQDDEILSQGYLAVLGAKKIFSVIEMLDGNATIGAGVTDHLGQTRIVLDEGHGNSSDSIGRGCS